MQANICFHSNVAGLCRLNATATDFCCVKECLCLHYTITGRCHFSLHMLGAGSGKQLLLDKSSVWELNHFTTRSNSFFVIVISHKRVCVIVLCGFAHKHGGFRHHVLCVCVCNNTLNCDQITVMQKGSLQEVYFFNKMVPKMLYNPMFNKLNQQALVSKQNNAKKIWVLWREQCVKHSA